MGKRHEVVRVACALTRPGEALEYRIPRIRAGVNTLVIAQARMTLCEGSWFDDHDHLGDHDITGRVWPRLPGLRRLVVESGWDIFERIDHEAIEAIDIRDGVPFCTVPGYARPWHAPSLRAIAWHYRVDCTGTGAAAKSADFAPLWQAHAPALREVDLSRSELRDRERETPLLETEGFGALLARLEVLRLPHHAIGRTPERLTAMLREHAPRLAHLRELAVTKLDGVEELELRALVPGFVSIG